MPKMTEDTKLAMAARFAEIYVYEHPGHLTNSYRQLAQERGIEYSKTHSLRSQASRYYQKPYVKEAVAAERERAKEQFAINKDEIVAALKDIAFDEECGRKDRLCALRTLNEMGGFNQQNVNLAAQAQIDVVVE